MSTIVRAPTPAAAAEVAAAPADRPAGDAAAVLRTLVAALVVAAVVEIVLVRIAYRVGVYLPKDEGMRAAYGAMTAVGTFALNAASLLALAALGTLAVLARRSGNAWLGWSSIAFVAASVAAVVLPASAAASAGVRLAFTGALLAALAPPLRAPDRSRLDRLALAAVGSALLAATAAGAGSGSGAAVPWSGAAVEQLQLAAETLAVAAAIALGASWLRAATRPVAGAVAGAAIAAAGVVGAFAANGALVGILALWTSGFRVFLPFPVYVVAAGAFAAGAIGWRRRLPLRTAALVLLAVAGLLLESSYQQALALVAVVLLGDGAAVGLADGPRAPRMKVP